MKAEDFIKPTPWDRAVLGMDTYEITNPTQGVLDMALSRPGHYTVKQDPVAAKGMLFDYGFYYCDTLIHPHCTLQRFVFHENDRVGISRESELAELLGICHGSFAYGRFHRDFNVSREVADRRYDNWLRQLYEAGNVYALLYADELAGFIGYSDNRLVLHAVSERYIGKGLSKYLWSAVCKALFDSGCRELSSSISAANLAAVNLYASLGFKFTHPVDVYHKVVR